MYLCNAAGIASALDRALTCHTYTIDHPVVDCDGTCDFMHVCVCVGGAAQPVATSMGTWGSKCPTVFVLPSCVGVIVELWALRPLIIMSPLVGYWQEDLPAQGLNASVVHRHPRLVHWGAIASHGCHV